MEIALTMLLTAAMTAGAGQAAHGEGPDLSALQSTLSRVWLRLDADGGKPGAAAEARALLAEAAVPDPSAAEHIARAERLANQAYKGDDADRAMLAQAVDERAKGLRARTGRAADYEAMALLLTDVARMEDAVLFQEFAVLFSRGTPDCARQERQLARLKSNRFINRRRANRPEEARGLFGNWRATDDQFPGYTDDARIKPGPGRTIRLQRRFANRWLDVVKGFEVRDGAETWIVWLARFPGAVEATLWLDLSADGRTLSFELPRISDLSDSSHPRAYALEGYTRWTLTRARKTPS